MFLSYFKIQSWSLNWWFQDGWMPPVAQNWQVACHPCHPCHPLLRRPCSLKWLDELQHEIRITWSSVSLCKTLCYCASFYWDKSKQNKCSWVTAFSLRSNKQTSEVVKSSKKTVFLRPRVNCFPLKLVQLCSELPRLVSQLLQNKTEPFIDQHPIVKYFHLIVMEIRNR